MPPFLFRKTTNEEALKPLKEAWLKTLLSPQDGMWESFTNAADQWELVADNKTIGYCCIDDEGYLLQFFVLPARLHQAPSMLQQFINQENVKKGIIGTNNPIMLSCAMHLQNSIDLHTYLFTDLLNSSADQKEISPFEAEKKDLSKIIDFYHFSVGAPKGWLEQYLGSLITRNELFVLENNSEIIGTCEVRKSESNSNIADVGMVISPNHRKKGWGAYLLGKAKEIAIQWNREPICSCEKNNIASLKSIHKNGFRSIHQMLEFKF